MAQGASSHTGVSSGIPILGDRRATAASCPGQHLRWTEKPRVNLHAWMRAPG